LNLVTENADSQENISLMKPAQDVDYANKSAFQPR